MYYSLFILNFPNDSNVLLVSYEEMKTDLNKCVKAIASFLGHDLSGGELIKITEQCTFNLCAPTIQYGFLVSAQGGIYVIDIIHNHPCIQLN